MIPDMPHDFAPASQEGLMFEALRKLPNDYYVFHSFRITSITSQVFYESETDFVVFNQKYGVICLEAKAGAVKYENGYWYYSNGTRMHNGGPFNQASSNKYKLIHYIEHSKSAPLLAKCKFLHGVWFPSITDAILNTMILPSEADKKIILTKEALDNPEKYLRSIYEIELPSKIQCSLTESEAKRLIREAFCPQFNVFPTTTFENDLKKMVFHRLLKEQSGILNYLTEQKVAVINGAAGTGKTMIAVEKAQRHANEGEKVLFLCYNAKLRDFLEDNYGNVNIDFYTIAALACKICGTATADYQNLASRLDDLFFHDAFPYKHIVVDEGQDFGTDPIESQNILIQLKDNITSEGIDGTFYVFYDEHQLVQSNDIPKFIKDADCKLKLYRNCRNTENIAITSLKVIPKYKLKLIEGSVKGVPAKIYYREIKDAILCLDEILNEYKIEGLKDIVILTCKTESESFLANFVQNGKYRDKYLFTTCRKFKGLEADAVILIDVDANTFDGQNVMLYYVGTSRARLRLSLIAQLDDEKCREILLKRLKYDRKIKIPRRDLASALNSLGDIE